MHAGLHVGCSSGVTWGCSILAQDGGWLGLIACPKFVTFLIGRQLLWERPASCSSTAATASTAVAGNSDCCLPAEASRGPQKLHLRKLERYAWAVALDEI